MGTCCFWAGFFNVQLHTKCAVLEKLVELRRKTCDSQAFYEVTQWCKKVNNSKNGIFRYEIRGDSLGAQGGGAPLLKFLPILGTQPPRILAYGRGCSWSTSKLGRG